MLAARPTLLLALALEGASPADRAELLALLHGRRERRRGRRQSWAASASCSTQAQVFDKAEKLIEKFRARAEAVADEIEPAELRELLYYLVDNVLDRQPPPEPAAASLIPLTLA